MTTSQAVLDEAGQDRWWRFRCGEPNRDQFPIRCRRDLNHPSPHVGFWRSQPPSEPVVWPGEGNSEPVQVTGQHCWCSKRE